jgi:hypothetical protein
LDGVTHVLCRLDKFPKAVVIPILSAGGGNHARITIPGAGWSTGSARFAGSGRLCCRQLARKSPKCRDRQYGAPKGLAVRNGYTYTREFAHASVRLDIENQTGEVVWH